MKELKYLKEQVETIKKLYTAYDDICLLIEMGYEENDPSMAEEIGAEIKEFEGVFEGLRIQTLLSGEYDSCNAIVTIHAGAGGRNPVTGLVCFIGCTAAFQRERASPFRCWTIWTGILQGRRP